MSVFFDVNQIKEKISLLGLLRNLGFIPQKVSGREYFFLSMLREEYTASLCVNDELGVWFDHGGAGVSGIRGGTVIDFGLAYWYPSGFPEVLSKIVEHSGISVDQVEEKSGKNDHVLSPINFPNYHIEIVEDVIASTAITSYLDRRGVLGVSKGYLYELHYQISNGIGKKKIFFAPAWPNENGGWEVRNKYFKGCLGHKGMTFIGGAANRLCVFEGYFDFLSWRVENCEDAASVLVLNSLSFLQAAKARANKFDLIELYFSQNKQGLLATKEFLSDVDGSRDFSSTYIGFKNYNEKLVAGLKPQ